MYGAKRTRRSRQLARVQYSLSVQEKRSTTRRVAFGIGAFPGRAARGPHLHASMLGIARGLENAD